MIILGLIAIFAIPYFNQLSFEGEKQGSAMYVFACFIGLPALGIFIAGVVEYNSRSKSGKEGQQESKVEKKVEKNDSLSHDTIYIINGRVFMPIEE